MYQNQIPEQESIGVLDVAGAFLNPINYYKYNPNLWSMSRGQIKIPLLSGSNIRSVASTMRKYGGAPGKKFVDFVKNKTGLGSLGGVMKAEEIWVGSAPMASDNIFGITTKYSPLREQRLASVAAERSRRASAKAFENVFSPKPTSSYIAPQPNIFDIKSTKSGRWNTGRRITRSSWTTLPADVSRSTKDLQSASRRLVSGLDGFGKLRDRFKRTGIATGKFIKGAYSRLPGAAKVSMRIGAGIGKGFAYYQIAKFAYSMINMAFEPLGRSAIGAVDSIFNSKDLLGLPEMGGNLKMEYLTRGAATERQRAMQAIQKSRLNARQGMGGEAALIHR